MPVTAPRIGVAGATTAITRRTTLRKAFLAPWHELVEQCFLFSLDAEAQASQLIYEYLNEQRRWRDDQPQPLGSALVEVDRRPLDLDVAQLPQAEVEVGARHMLGPLDEARGGLANPLVLEAPEAALR